MSYLKSIKKIFLIFNVFQRPGRHVILPRVAHAAHGEGIKLMWWKREKESEGRMNGGDLLRADRLGGETESRWQSWHLSYTEICLEPFSTCLFFFFFLACSARYAKNRHSQVLTLCDHAFPELFAHNGMPHPYKTPLKSFHSVSPSPCKQTEGPFSTGESVVKSLICGPHAAHSPQTPQNTQVHTGLCSYPCGGFHSHLFTSHFVRVHSCF